MSASDEESARLSSWAKRGILVPRSASDEGSARLSSWAKRRICCWRLS